MGLLDQPNEFRAFVGEAATAFEAAEKAGRISPSGKRRLLAELRKIGSGYEALIGDGGTMPGHKVQDRWG